MDIITTATIIVIIIIIDTVTTDSAIEVKWCRDVRTRSPSLINFKAVSYLCFDFVIVPLKWINKYALSEQLSDQKSSMFNSCSFQVWCSSGILTRCSFQPKSITIKVITVIWIYRQVCVQIYEIKQSGRGDWSV